MHASLNTVLSHTAHDHTHESWGHHVYKLSVSKVKSSLVNLKNKWLHLNGDDPEVSNFGLIALVVIALLLGASFYVSFFDGWFRDFWFMLTKGGL